MTCSDAGPGRTDEFRALLDSIGVRADAPILLAGSTWAPEEKIIAETFISLRREFPGLFQPESASRERAQCRAGVALRSGRDGCSGGCLPQPRA